MSQASHAFQLVVDKICPTPAPQDDEPRDYLQEARWILAGKSMLMTQYEHLAALDRDYLKRIAELTARNIYLESDEYAEEVANNMLGGEAAAQDYEGDLL